MSSSFTVILFYKYCQISDPEKLKIDQLALCQMLGLKGRIIVAHEGINGTLEGFSDSIDKYIDQMKRDKRFDDINYKKSLGNGSAFPKLSVKVRSEIVKSNFEVDPTMMTGKYLESETLHKWFEEKKEFYIVDMRNDYEYLSGYFKDSVFANIHNFYDLPSVLPKLEHLKDKVVVTVCTGGVRCEKASGFLIKNGFKEVYQLKDGIYTYMEKYPNEHFLGKLYVFDNRLTVGFNVNSDKHKVVGKCMHCGKSSDNYVNCSLDDCHLHFISCKNCMDPKINLAFCQSECKDLYLNNLVAKKSF